MTNTFQLQHVVLKRERKKQSCKNELNYMDASKHESLVRSTARIYVCCPSHLSFTQHWDSILLSFSPVPHSPTQYMFARRLRPDDTHHYPGSDQTIFLLGFQQNSRFQWIWQAPNVAPYTLSAGLSGICIIKSHGSFNRPDLPRRSWMAPLLSHWCSIPLATLDYTLWRSIRLVFLFFVFYVQG